MKKLTNGLLYLAIFLLSAFFLNQALLAIMEYLGMAGKTVSIFWYYLTYPLAAFISWRVGKRGLQRSALNRYFFSAILAAILADVALVVASLALVQALSTVESVRDYLTSRRGANLLAMLAVLEELLMVAVFAAVFSLMTGKKIRYINEISARVAHMEELLPVRGDDEIARLSQSINRMWTELMEKRREEQRQSEMQTRMIGDISHDLRTPLTTIQGYVDLIRQSGEALPAEERQEYLRIVQRKLNDLNGQINQLFAYTKLSQTDYSLNLQKMDAAAFLRHICASYRLMFEQAGFAWRCELPGEPLIMEFDPQKLGQAIENLLENALKYAVPATEVRFSCELQESYVYLRTANRVDSSIQAALPYLFERFYRADQARPTGGTGLGLPIVKKIVELHHGSIQATYEDEYLTFTISLPRAL